MNKLKNEKIENQIAFFNKNALSKQNIYFEPKDVFEWYAIKPVIRAMKFLYSDRLDYQYLDYGCGIGDSIEIFKISNHKYPDRLVGVDISKNAIAEISKRYQFEFIHIEAESGIKGLGICVDAAYMMHVLHHSVDHEKIIKDISSAIKGRGKIAIVDISSKNPFQELGRRLFTILPVGVKRKFQNDLVVDGEIPEKLPVDIEKIKKYLENEGFTVNLSYSSSFIFIFGWLFNLLNIKFGKNSLIINFFLKLDDWLSNNVFKNYSVLYLIEAERA